MEFSFYTFLLTLSISNYKLSKSSSPSQKTTNGVQLPPLDNISPTTFASKDTKTFGGFNSTCQSFHKFGRFSSWTCNTPLMTNYTYAVLVIKPSKKIQEYRYRILVFGKTNSKRETGDVFLDNSNSYQTWIYYEEENAWKMIDSVANGFIWKTLLRLVTICSSQVIILCPDATNSTWIFLIDQLRWKQVAIVGDGPSWTDIRDDMFAEAVKSENSLCSCGQDIFVFYAIDDGNHFVGYRLSCVIELTTYRWEKVGNYTIPFSHSLHLVAGWSGKTTVLAMVDECIWKYSIRKSIWNRTKLCLPYDSWRIVAADTVLDVLFVNDRREVLYINIPRNLVITMSLFNGAVLVKNIHLGYDFESVMSSYTLIFMKHPRMTTKVYKYILRYSNQDIKYYFPQFNNFCSSASAWSLQRHIEAGEQSWNIARIDSTSLIPSDYGFQSLWKNTYYRIVFPSHDVRFAPPAMWSMNLGTMRWQMVGYLNVTGINIPNEILTSVTASRYMQKNMLLVVSRRYTLLITSRDHMQITSSPSPSRYAFTVLTINSTSALLFGGCNEYNVFNDLWQFSLTRRNWTKVEMIKSSGPGAGSVIDDSAETVPSPRCGHAAAVIEGDMFVFGGYDFHLNLNLELWKYNMINNSWRYLEPINKLPHMTDDICYFVATAQSKMIWIASRCPVFLGNKNLNFDGSFHLWMFIVHLQTWHFVALEKLKDVPHKSLFSSLHFRRGYLISLEPSSLLYIKAGCPEGLGSSNISRFPCDVCKIGFYSDVKTTDCRKCPNGTTTRDERSPRLTACNVCVAGTCRHGRCLVVSNSLTQVPVCTCTVGFTGSHCQDATYYYIGTGVILVIVIITLFVVVLRHIIKKRKERETAFCRHIQNLNDAWQISWQEIELQDEIGGGASGRVWKAQYRNIDVAVKMLIDNNEAQSSLEFAGEIKFMQTMRHRNIVLFIGAGKTSPQARPFLVVEFAHRGSLRHVLDDVSIEIDQNRKIDFALDASKGMEFLHKLNPPRIHRDLKSENLLVCKSWIVKVADFGLGRLFGGARKSRRSKRNNSVSSNNSENELLAEMRDFSEEAIGTVRWNAPELARREIYHESIDVYRYSMMSISL